MSAFQPFGQLHHSSVHPNISSVLQFGGFVNNNDPDAGSAPTMIPPRKRAKKAPTLNADAWAPHRARVLQLHVEEGRSLKEVARIMEEECGFKANERQYRTRISQWNKDKNIKPGEMQAIVRKRQFRKLMETEKLPQRFEIRGKPVNGERIDRWMKRNSARDDELYTPDVEMTTPSAVECQTISSLSGSTTGPHSAPSLRSLSPRILPDRSPQTHLPPNSPSLSEIIGSPLSSFAGHSPAVLGPESPQAYQSVVTSASHPTTQHQLEVSLQDSDDFEWQSFLSEHNGPVAIPSKMSRNPMGHIASVYNPARVDAAKEHELILAFKRYETNGLHLSEESLMALISLGQILRDQARYNTAIAVFKHAIFLSQQNPTLEMSVINWALIAIGYVFLLLHRTKRAELTFRKVLSLDANNMFISNHVSQLLAKACLGRVLSVQKKKEEAEAISLQVLQECTGFDGNANRASALIIATGVLVNYYMYLQRFREAEELAVPVLVTAMKVPVGAFDFLFNILNSLVRIYQIECRQLEALELINKIVSGMETMFGKASPNTLRSLEYLATFYRIEGKLSEAESILRMVLDGYLAIYGVQHPNISAVMTNLAAVLAQQQKWDDANKLGENAVRDLTQVLGPQDIQTVEAAANLGYIYQKQQRFEEAYPLLQDAVEVLEQGLFHELLCLHRAIKSLLEICRAQQRWDEIEELEDIEKGLQVQRKYTEMELQFL